MTRAELDLLRVKVRIEAIEVLLRGLYTGLANSSPTGGQAFRERFDRLREEHDKVAIPGIPPEMSDMVAGEYQAALDSLMSFIAAGFHN